MICFVEALWHDDTACGNILRSFVIVLELLGKNTFSTMRASNQEISYFIENYRET